MNVKRWGWLLAIMGVSLCWAVAAEARRITDMAGRQVDVPEKIQRVYGTSPPATFMVYAMDPGLVVGLNSPLTADEKPLLDPRLVRLPVIGGWFGQGRVANMETLLQVQPDIVLVWMWQETAAKRKIEQSLRPLGIPVVYLALDRLADYPAAFRFLGELFGRRPRAEALAGCAERMLAEAARSAATIAPEQRLSVYYAEGTDGLSTECHLSMHAQLIPLSGGINVHRCSQRNIVGMQKITMEQLLQYDPQVVVYHEPLLRDRLAQDPRWQNIRAVRDGWVYQIPRTPFNWFDRPPSFMRLLGLKWMIHHLYPGAADGDLVAETRDFYQLFLNVALDEAAARKLLQP